MNICKSIVVGISMVMIVCACKSPQDKILDDFKKADSAIQEANATVADEDSLTLVSLSILAMQDKNPQLAMQADSIYLATTTTVNLIDSIKNVLNEKDTKGENTDVALQLMNTNNTGDRLYNSLIAANKYIVKDTAVKSDGHNMLYSDINTTPSATTFIQKYFTNTLTVSAITILSKFKLDCTTTAIVALNDIKRRLKY